MSDWETEIRYNLARRKDDGVFTPYDEARKWRRRFWYAMILLVAMSILVLALAKNS